MVDGFTIRDDEGNIIKQQLFVDPGQGHRKVSVITSDGVEEVVETEHMLVVAIREFDGERVCFMRASCGSATTYPLMIAAMMESLPLPLLQEGVSIYNTRMMMKAAEMLRRAFEEGLDDSGDDE